METNLRYFHPHIPRHFLRRTLQCFEASVAHISYAISNVGWAVHVFDSRATHTDIMAQ